jgi:hypothetical protein
MGNNEEEHTLNQCKNTTTRVSCRRSLFYIDILSMLFSFYILVLVEMDGIESKSNVIMLASTNRADVLDKVISR